MDTLKVNTPEELHQAIGEFLQSNYSRENLVKMYDDTRKCATSFRGIYSALPVLSAHKSDPLDGLQYIMDWSREASKVVDDIASNLEQQTISEAISQLKKLRGFADSVLSLVDTKLKEQAQKEARAKVEKEYKNLNEEASKTKGMLLIQQAEVVMKLELEAQAILRRETKDAVQIYLSKDPTFKNRVSQHDDEINKVFERLNKLVGSDTPTGKLLDIYCRLKNIPLQSQFDDVGYAYSPIDDWADVICGVCNRLYTSIDNVIKTFKEIQTKANLKIEETHPQKIQELLKILQIKPDHKQNQPLRDFAKEVGAQQPNASGVEFRDKIVRNIHLALQTASMIDPSETKAAPKDKGESAETGQDTKREREGMIEAKPPETLAKMLWLKQHGKKHWKLISIMILVILIPSLFVLPKIELFSKKPNVTANSNIFADVSKDGSILRSNKFPWEIKKTKGRDGNILYTLVDRRGDPTAISVVPDNPKYTTYQSYDGMVIKFTCAEEKISDFTIKVKY